MLKQAEKLKKGETPLAEPRRQPIDIDAGFERAMKRFPRIIARLAK